MRGFFGLRYPKTAALAAAACFYIPFVADWCEPGPALRQAVAILDGTVGLTHPVVWDALVRLFGRDAALLGTVSMVAAFACAVLVAFLSGDLAAIALRAMRRRISMSDESADWIRCRAEFFTALAFILTPGFFHAATRLGPLHLLLLPLLAGLALLTRVLATGEGNLYWRLKQGFPRVVLALALLGCAWFEMSLVKGFLRSERPAFAVFAAIGIFPLMVLAHLMRRRLLLTRKSYVRFLLAWILVLAAAGVASLSHAGRGSVASRVVRRILGEGAGFRAIVSDGPLDSVFAFMTPADRLLIRPSRDGDAAYGRELSAWVRENCADRPELAFAAELGPQALAEEWTASADGSPRGGLLTPDLYFPTLEKWREACSELIGMDGREPCGAEVRALLAEAGDRFALRLLERGERAKAWKIFWEVVNSVDAGDCEALDRLSEMFREGHPATPEERDRLTERFEAVGGVKAFARRAETKRTKDSSAGEARNGLSSHAQALLEKASVVPETPGEALQLRETVRRGIESGLVKPNQIGAQLLALDCRLEDWESARRDAVDVLRLDRGHVRANAVMGKLACFSRDYRAAEHYLRLAQAGGADDDGAVAKDLAFVRARLEPADAASPARPVDAPRPLGGTGRRTSVGRWGRALLAFVLVAVAYFVESTVTRTRARRARKERAVVSKCRAQMEAAFRDAERERMAAAPTREERPERTARAPVPAHRPYSQLTQEERDARKNWTRARLMRHSRKPDWKHDRAYLELVLEAAQGGCSEAMNKLGEYALRRRSYVEAYYWALKVELAGARHVGLQPEAILRHWVKHHSSTHHHRFHAGFSDTEYHFARAVMRVRSGVDSDKGLKRLRRLVEEEFDDAELFVQKNDLP